MNVLLNFLKVYASKFDFLKGYASKASKSSSLCLQIPSVGGTLYCNFMPPAHCKEMRIITISGFRWSSFCFDTLTEIRVDHPVLLGMQGDTDGPHCEVQNQGSLERRFLAVDQVARRPHHQP